jgi:hypothetical protein
MSFSTIAPRLGRAHAQMSEVERVLGWMRDRWKGGISVLVQCEQYTGVDGLRWVRVDRVTADATPYPIKGQIPTWDFQRGMLPNGIPGQWAFWEVAGIRWLSDDYPELLEMHPDFPRPPLRHPWGETDPPCSETWPFYGSRGWLSQIKLEAKLFDGEPHELNKALLELAKDRDIPIIHTMDRHPEPSKRSLIESLRPKTLEEINRAIRPSPMRSDSLQRFTDRKDRP